MSFRTTTILALGFAGLTIVAQAQTQSSPTTGARATGQAELSVDFSDRQREAIGKSIMATDTHQPTPKDFEAAIGKEIPSSVNLHPFPQDLAREIPQLERLMYAHLNRNVLIVDALADKVVALVPLGGDAAQTGSAPTAADAIGGLGGYSDAQLVALYQSAGTQIQQAPNEVVLRAGTKLPEGVMAEALPEQIATNTPQAKGLHYAKLADGRMLLVNPQDRMIVGIIAAREGTVAQGQGQSTGQGQSQEKSADPLKQMEKDGNPSAYTGPSTGGPNTD